MDTISTPTCQPGSPDYNLDCQSAMERAFQAVAVDTEVAGWGNGEIAYALLKPVKQKGMIADGDIELQSMAA